MALLIGQHIVNSMSDSQQHGSLGSVPKREKDFWSVILFQWCKWSSKLVIQLWLKSTEQLEIEKKNAD